MTDNGCCGGACCSNTGIQIETNSAISAKNSENFSAAKVEEPPSEFVDYRAENNVMWEQPWAYKYTDGNIDE